MSSTDEPTAVPDQIIEPTASYEIVKESFDTPKLSIESVKADNFPPASVDSVKFSEQSSPSPSVDYEKRNWN